LLRKDLTRFSSTSFLTCLAQRSLGEVGIRNLDSRFLPAGRHGRENDTTMQKLLIATKNKGKLGELKEFLSDLPIDLVSLTDVGIEDDVEETGTTYQENAELKAVYYAKMSNLPAISDDGGIEISALNGEPGVHSKRWLGEEATEEDLINHMKKVAKELPDENRKAYFKTVVSLARPDGKVWSVAGEIGGVIAKEPYLKHLKGYPYRSFFYLPEIKKFYHENELNPEEMKKYNHRYKAIQQLRPLLTQELSLKV